mgnify:CR=1 FL=1
MNFKWQPLYDNNECVHLELVSTKKNGSQIDINFFFGLFVCIFVTKHD